MRGRYIGEIVEIHPTWEKSKLIWVTNEQWSEDGKSHHHPAFWFEFEGWLYYGIVDYEFGFLEQYEDWVINEDEYEFNSYSPKKIEFDLLVNFYSPLNLVNDPNKSYDTKYYKLDYEKAMQGDLDHWCQWEIEFTKEWNRDMKLKELLNGN